MRRHVIWVLFVGILLFLIGCQGDTGPATRDPRALDLVEGTDVSGGAAAVTETVTVVSPSPTASSTSTLTATASPPAVTETPLPAATFSPTVAEASTRQTTPTPTASPLVAVTEGLVVNTDCGDQGTTRLSRVYWGEESPPISSPDGRFLAQSLNPNGDARLVVTRSTEASRVVIEAPDKGLPVGMPFWSPATAAGAQPRLVFANVALSQPGGGSIYVVGADAMDLIHVADYVGYHDDLAWSPDGRWIAYTSASTVSGSGSGMQVRDYQVLLVAADGSAGPAVVGAGCNPHWELAAPEILAFQVMPSQAEPGETVSLAWQARGDRATLCPTARYTLFTVDDCSRVPVSGFTMFLLPPEVEGFQSVDLVLKVETFDPPGEATAQATIALECATTWFYSDAPQAGVCPLEPVRTEAAAQRFEGGRMIWLRGPGRYYVLHDASLADGQDRHRLDVIVDPLEITRDTSGDVQAPPGLHAPESGFGLVWRGDVAQSPGYQEELGWALEPEFGYDAILQCDDARPSGGQSWQTCYVRGPDGEVIVLHPLGGWTHLGE